MTLDEFKFSYDMLNSQSKMDTLWVNLTQLLSLGDGHRELAVRAIQYFMIGEDPSAEFVWTVMDALEVKAKALGHSFQLVTVHREDATDLKRPTIKQAEMH